MPLMLAGHGCARKLGSAPYPGASSISEREISHREACVRAGGLAVGGADGAEQRGERRAERMRRTLEQP
jgi:hypothetical protein